MSEEQIETTEAADVKLRTGFAVLIDMEGNVFVERNTEVLSVPVDRMANLLEIRRAVSDISMDLQAQTSAEYVVKLMAAQQES